jgi:tetratricopeptide (TPR) repeat protein
MKDIKYDTNDGLAEFEAAEKLRHANKFADAMKAYQSVAQNFPQSDYAPRSELHIGDCLLGLRQPAAAMAHWKKFIAPAPAGPWRGQAYVGVIDYCLEEQLDLPEAGKYADLARNSLPSALHSPSPAKPSAKQDGDAGPSANNSAALALRSRSPSEASAKEGGEAGWSLVAYDIHLRVGLVSFCEGKAAIAAEAFTAAKAAAANKATDESLDSLIAAAKTGKPVIPADCRDSGSGRRGVADLSGRSAAKHEGDLSGVAVAKSEAGPSGASVSSSDQPALALSMGIIHLLAGRPDNADNMFDRILGGAAANHGVASAKTGGGPNPSPSGGGKGGGPSPSPSGGGEGGGAIRPAGVPFGHNQKPALAGSSPAQLSFATFGRGAVLQARKKLDDAKAQFLASIKAFPAGSWHDETLYRLATITQDQAPSPSKGEVAPGAGGGVPAKPAQATRIISAKQEALSYWQEIISRYPKSPRCEQAFYNAGVLLCEIAELADAPGLRSSKSEAGWKDAAFMLGRFTEFYPKSPFAGDAYVREIDVALERMFDLKLAESLADTGSQWIKRWEDAAARPEAKPEYGPWQVPPSIPDQATIKFVVYDLRLRGIFAAYLAEKYEKAKQLLAATGPLEPKDGRIDAEKVQKVGLFFLQKAIAAQKPIWNADVLAKAKTDPQRTALKLADLYLKVVRPDKSAAIYERIIDKDPVFAPALPGLELYACIQLARSYSYDRKDHDKAITTLQMLYRPEFAKEPQLAEGLVWLGTLTFNFKQDAKKAMPHFEYVVTHFPDSPSAERAMYFCALTAIAAKDKAQAASACNEFIAKYPQSTWAKHIVSLLKDQVAKLPEKTKEKR